MTIFDRKRVMLATDESPGISRGTACKYLITYYVDTLTGYHNKMHGVVRDKTALYKE